MNTNLHESVVLTDDEMEKYSIVEIPFSGILKFLTIFLA
jgi:hypothetical protein